MKRYRAFEKSLQTGRSVVSFIAACALALGAAGANGADTFPPRDVSGASPVANSVPMSGADLEEAFWVCDYVATTRGVEATPATLCESVYDELKATKFGGEFGLLLTWWQQNKRSEHGRLASRIW